MRTLDGRALVSGRAQGTILLSMHSITLWGGVSPSSGQIIDPRNDRHGECVSGRVFAVIGEKGSSTGSAVLLEMARVGTAPAAIVVRSTTPTMALGALIARELYGTVVPVVQLGVREFAALHDGESVRVEDDGTICKT